MRNPNEEQSQQAATHREPRLKQPENRPEFPGGARLFDPPDDLYQLTDRFQQPSPAVRAQCMYFLNNDRPTLEASLRAWVNALYRQAPEPDKLSTRRLNHLIYSQRGLKLREFIDLAQSEDFSSAIFHLTGLRLGTMAKEAKRSGQPPGGQSGEDGEGCQTVHFTSKKKGGKKVPPKWLKPKAKEKASNRLTKASNRLTKKANPKRRSRLTR